MKRQQIRLILKNQNLKFEKLKFINFASDCQLTHPIFSSIHTSFVPQVIKVKRKYPSNSPMMGPPRSKTIIN